MAPLVLEGDDKFPCPSKVVSAHFEIETLSESSHCLVSNMDVVEAQSIALGLGGTRFRHDSESPSPSLRREISVGTRHNIVPSSLTAEELNAAGESER